MHLTAPNTTSSDYSLPGTSLNFLRQLVVSQGLARVFEFGSGKSTKMFLEADCETTSLEDSPAWLAETKKGLPGHLLARWRPLCHPLTSLFLKGAPMKGWQLDAATRQALGAAQLVLIDSPAFPPFREDALVSALRTLQAGSIVVDDASIPTVRRFCERLAQANELASQYWPGDHGLFVITVTPREAAAASRFGRAENRQAIRISRGWWETLKAWRRYALA